MTLTSELRRAIAIDQMVLHYQPKVDLRTGAVEGVEAMVRWHHPYHGLLGPDQFIGLAEHTGLIKPLTLWALETALRQCAEWSDKGIHLHVSVNLPARNMQDSHLPEAISSFLEKYGLAAANLVVEIVESSVMSDPLRAMRDDDNRRCLSIG